MTKTILQITKVDPVTLIDIKPTFNDLHETDHADGKYRLRKYSRVSASVSEVVELTDVGAGKFTQSKAYNKHQGGKIRNFDSIDPDVINSAGLRTMVKIFRGACSSRTTLSEAQNCPAPMSIFDIHQMRIKCLGGATQIAPEGWHQDGYKHIAMIGIDRNNIIGGEILLSTDKTEQPFLQAVIDTGTMVMVDDSYLWHNGRSIQPVDDSKPAWMDILVLTSK